MRTRYCPLCRQAASNRLAEVSHLRKHVRAGELLEEDPDPDGPTFRLPEGGLAFTHGYDLLRWDRASWETLEDAHQRAQGEFLLRLCRRLGERQEETRRAIMAHVTRS